jgi:CHAT domain-containing protein
MRLVVVPYAATHLLPLAALPFDGQPLGVTHALSTLPSASMLQFVKLDAPLRASATGAVDALHVLAVGNPAGDLRGAEFEATYVARLYGDAPLLGEAATLAAVLERLPGCRVLHFATHGRLVEDAPLASSLMLAGGDELTVHQLMGLRLDADLVVLSACETGRGEATGGDDVVGLTRSLLAAGARAVVVSLWPVDDVATSLFMGEFHRNLLGGMVPALALHRALVVLRGAGAHERRRLADELVLDPCGTALLDGATERHLGPGSAVVSADLQHLYYWASFVLVG